MKDEKIKEEDLLHVFGIQTTNGANIHFHSGYGSGIGVYPLQAYLNHSCRCVYHFLIVCTYWKYLFRSNTETLEQPGDHIVHIFANTNIPAGSQLTTSYISNCQPTRVRRQLLYETWNFWCSCFVCSDKTEEGTYRSGLSCGSRCMGPVLPVDPLSNHTEWECTICGKIISSKQAETQTELAHEVSF